MVASQPIAKDGVGAEHGEAADTERQKDEIEHDVFLLRGHRPERRHPNIKSLLGNETWGIRLE